MKFSELGLSESLLKAVKRSGYEEATPIQAETIPMVLDGKDVIGEAQTGTGKTAAFGLPIIEHIDPSNPEIQALVISPTVSWQFKLKKNYIDWVKIKKS